MAGHRGHPERSLGHRRPQPGHTHGVSPPVASEHKGGPARHLERPPGLQRSPRTSRGPGAPPTTATAVAASAPEPSSHTHAAGRPSHSDVYQTHAGPPTGPRSKGTHQGDADAGRRWPGATPQRWSRLGTHMGLPQRSQRAARRESIGRPQRWGGGAHAGQGPTRAGAREPTGGTQAETSGTARATGKRRPRDPTTTDARPALSTATEPPHEPRTPPPGGPKATTATSPTPGHHTWDLIHP